MDPDLYDEFGNYVGPDLESEDDSDSEEEQQREEEEGDGVDQEERQLDEEEAVQSMVASNIQLHGGGGL
jgi:hypothetical protein